MQLQTTISTSLILIQYKAQQAYQPRGLTGEPLQQVLSGVSNTRWQVRCLPTLLAEKLLTAAKGSTTPARGSVLNPVPRMSPLENLTGLHLNSEPNRCPPKNLFPGHNKNTISQMRLQLMSQSMGTGVVGSGLPILCVSMLLPLFVSWLA